MPDQHAGCSRDPKSASARLAEYRDRVMHYKPDLNRRWDPVSLAYVGASIGAILVIGHGVYVTYLHRFPDTDLLLHIANEVMEAGILGALLFAAVARVRNWLVEHSR
jgi:hypothetical protein